MRLIFVVILFFCFNVFGQEPDIYTIELPERKAKHQAWRHEKAGFSFYYIKCDTLNKPVYVYEIEQDDRLIYFDWFIFELRLIPKRYHKYIHTYCYIEFSLENDKMFITE